MSRFATAAPFHSKRDGRVRTWRDCMGNVTPLEILNCLTQQNVACGLKLTKKAWMFEVEHSELNECSIDNSDRSECSTPNNQPLFYLFCYNVPFILLHHVKNNHLKQNSRQYTYFEMI